MGAPLALWLDESRLRVVGKKPHRKEKIMTEIIQGVLFYTQDELNAEVTNATGIATRRESNRIYENTLGAMQRMTREGEIDDESATSIYNEIAELNGWATVTTLCPKWTVQVQLFNETVGEFTDIEANDEDEACDKVRENIEIDDFTICVSLSYGDESIEGEVHGSYRFDINDNLDFYAEEQN